MAWVRTTVALISLGFVLMKLGPASRAAGGEMPQHLAGKGRPLGVGMAVFGAVITLLAAWRYDAVNREIEEGRVKTDRALVWLVAITVAILAGLLIAHGF